MRQFFFLEPFEVHIYSILGVFSTIFFLVIVDIQQVQPISWSWEYIEKDSSYDGIIKGLSFSAIYDLFYKIFQLYCSSVIGLLYSLSTSSYYFIDLTGSRNFLL